MDGSDEWVHISIVVRSHNAHKLARLHNELTWDEVITLLFDKTAAFSIKKQPKAETATKTSGNLIAAER